MKRKLRILIVEDSSTMRLLLARILSSDSALEVVGQAVDPYEARELIIAQNPDVMTLDIDMPRMDGLTFLEKVMAHNPVRTLVLSHLSPKNSVLALKALEMGAIDVMVKPTIKGSEVLHTFAQEILERVKGVAEANLDIFPRIKEKIHQDSQVPFIKKNKSFLAPRHASPKVLAIASSTGGTEALKIILRGLPLEIPPILIVQHLAMGFDESFVRMMSKVCPYEIKVAEERDSVSPGRVLVAPSNYHMELDRNSQGHYEIHLHQGPPLHGLRPAADYTLNSVARVVGPHSIGVILTGMGRDGAQGLLAMKKAGALTIAQDKESCVVFGMPKEAIQLGAAQVVAALEKIPEVVASQLRSRGTKS